MTPEEHRAIALRQANAEYDTWDKESKRAAQAKRAKRKASKVERHEAKA